MAQGALALLTDRPRLEQMRTDARKTAQTRFCSTLVLPQYIAYYEKVIAGR